MIRPLRRRSRGQPLTMLGALAVAWIGARVMLWESPFSPMPVSLIAVSGQLADGDTSEDKASPPGFDNEANVGNADDHDGGGFWSRPHNSWSMAPTLPPAFAQIVGSDTLLSKPRPAGSPRSVFEAILPNLKRPPGAQVASSQIGNPPPPFAPPLATMLEPARGVDHWSLDAWAFWRQGSDATAISQGRVPIFGASQIGAVLNYRLAPISRHDPRLYGRFYQALVTNGEREFAAGVAGRPFAGVPLRAQAELRVTDNTFGTQARPAGLVVTEFSPLSLPGDLVAEAYLQAGYVGGTGQTAFADGQVSLTREVANFDLGAIKPARLSVGAGIWGGAQRDAERLDVGPNIRLDLQIGKVPARLSVDWRERVAGNAAPESGVAATLSTRF